jgi:hypothetical protein
MRFRRTTFALIGVSIGLLLSGSAWAQGVEIQARPPERGIEILPPPLHEDVTRPTDADFYAETPRVQHDPAFIEPLATDTETGHMGLSGWTSPETTAAPAVSGHREVNGWLAIGFSVTWGRPPAPMVRPAR